MTTHKDYLPILFFLLPFLVMAQKPLDYEKPIINNVVYDYLDIQFQNVEDDVKLEGTLIIPKESYSKIILIVPGSDRNTRFSHHRLAQKLLDDDIAVFRFDDRGIGLSEGKFNPLDANSLASDIVYAIKELISIPKLENKKIGVLGHSLGAIAAIKAASKTEEINYVIQLSAPVENPSNAFKYQAMQNLNDQYNYKNKSEKEIEHLFDTLTLITQKTFKDNNFKEVYNSGRKAIKKLNFKVRNVLWTYSYIDLIKEDLNQYYEQLNIPLLYLIGSEDKYVNPNAEVQQISAYENSFISIHKLEGLNHYFLDEKPTLENLYELDNSVTKIISEWVKIQIDNQ